MAIEKVMIQGEYPDRQALVNKVVIDPERWLVSTIVADRSLIEEADSAVLEEVGRMLGVIVQQCREYQKTQCEAELSEYSAPPGPEARTPVYGRVIGVTCVKAYCEAECLLRDAQSI